MAKQIRAFHRSHGRINIPPVMVIGLGRFGISLASELTANGVEVLGVDADSRVVKEHAPYLTDAVVADTTDPEALEQLGLDDIECVVVAVGTQLEASILTVSHLLDAGVPDIWAKASSEAHGRILSQLGVHHVVHPERDTGRRVAHLLGGKFREFAEVTPGYCVTSMSAPHAFTGFALNLDEIWRKHRVQIIAMKHGNGDVMPMVNGTVLAPSDIIIAGGSPGALESLNR